jgi:hypothetical protein
LISPEPVHPITEVYLIQWLPSQIVTNKAQFSRRVARGREAWHDRRMETPKTPDRSQLRRPSTQPYVRRKRVEVGGDAPEQRSSTAPRAVSEVAPSDETPTVQPTKKNARPRRVERASVEAASPCALPAAMNAEPRQAEAADAIASAVAVFIEPESRSAADAPASGGVAQVEDLELLPSPRHLPQGDPGDPAPAPGRVPSGDSRSLRRGNLFALVFRVHCFVVTRHGYLGQRGYWSAVEYPTPSAASHAYARGCSHWVSEGFLDYRG